MMKMMLSFVSFLLILEKANALTATFKDGSYLNTYALNTTHARFNVIVKSNQYFSLGFGKTMTNCDMVVWQANGANSKVVDLWSTGHPTPSTDSS